MKEIELIYSLLNVIRNAEHNNDESVHENLLRNFCRIHRAEILKKYYEGGITVNDEVFQMIPMTFTKVGANEFKATYPKVLKLNNDFGFYVEKYGTTISISTSQQYSQNRKDFFNKKFIDIKAENQTLVMRLPDSLESLDQASENYNLIKEFLDSVYLQELNNFNENENNPITITADFYGVLYNPDDCPTYDWEEDSYPFPAEALPELERQVLVREFGIMNSAKRDEIQNSRADEIRYHDNEDLRE